MRRRTTELSLPGYEPEAESEAAEARQDGRAMEERLTSWLLRLGLAFVLGYAATSSFVHPETFAGYLPWFLPGAWATELLPIFAVFETLLAVGLMTDRYAYPASVLAGLTMVGIVAVNPDAFDVLFRNVAIACGAFALAVHTRPARPADGPAPPPSPRSGADRGARSSGRGSSADGPRPAHGRARTLPRRSPPAGRARSGSARGTTSGR